MKKIILLLLFLATTSTAVLAQKKWYRGYYIKQDGDTVFGFMKRISSDFSPSSIEIAQDSTGFEAKQIAVAEIKEFALINGDIYKKYQALISTAFTDFVNIGYNPQINRVLKVVAFRVEQVSPDISFLTFKDKIKERYFILTKNDTMPTELDYHIYKLSEKNPEVIKIESYKNQLKNLVIRNGFTDSTQLNERIRYLAYDDVSILRFLSRYLPNTQNNKIFTQNYKLINKTTRRLFIAAGINTYKYKEPDRDPMLQGGQKLHFTPSISAGYDWVLDKERNDVYVRLELSAIPTGFKGTYSYTLLGTTINYNRSLSNFFVIGGPSVHVNIYNGTKTKLFAGAGIGYSASYRTIKTSDPNSFEDPVQRGSTGDFYIPITIDAFFSENYFISAGYTILDIMNPYRINMFGVRLNYILQSK